MTTAFTPLLCSYPITLPWMFTFGFTELPICCESVCLWFLSTLLLACSSIYRSSVRLRSWPSFSYHHLENSYFHRLLFLFSLDSSRTLLNIYDNIICGNSLTCQNGQFQLYVQQSLHSVNKIQLIASFCPTDSFSHFLNFFYRIMLAGKIQTSPHTTTCCIARRQDTSVYV